MKKYILIIISFFIPFFSFASNEILALDCKNLKGLTLRSEKFKKDSYSKVRLIIIFFGHNNKILFNWSQKTDSFVDIL